MRTIAVIGASNDPEKYGNRCVRMYRELGWTVYPVNPKETEIEGLPVFTSIREVPQPIDRISLYLTPKRIFPLLEDIAAAGAKDVFFNPGTESDELLAAARALGIPAREACALVAARLGK